MTNLEPVFYQLINKLKGKETATKDRYGHSFVDKAYIVAEVELIIGLVTTALILIYQQNFWLALGTLTGFLILEYFILMGISMAENIIYLRKQMDAVVRASLEGKPVQFDFDIEDLQEEDPYKLLRIIGITTAVVIGIVIARTYLTVNI